MLRRRGGVVRLLPLFGLVLVSSIVARASAPPAPMTGTISGRVTSSTTSLALLGTGVRLYSVAADDFIYFTTVDGNGDYSFNVPDGDYAVFTQNTQGYINEIYNNVPCSAVCDTNAITFLTVANNAFSNIDFVLDPGGRIAGNVTDSSTGLPIAGVTVSFIDPGAQVKFTKAVTDVNGNYITEGGTATGSVFAVTDNSLGYRNEVYNNVYCSDCDPTVSGTPIAVTNGVTTGGVNFALDLGGKITGTVRDGNGNPLANIFVNVTDATFTNFESGYTDAAGVYTTGGLPAGTYYVSTFNPFGYADMAYSGVLCPGNFCNAPAVGAPIPLTVGGTASNIDFTLVLGGQFSGAVTNAQGGAPVPLNAGNNGITIYNALGVQITTWPTDTDGLYTTGVLPPGTYYAQAVGAVGFGNQLYNNIQCQGCSITTGTQIVVTAGTVVPNINFALQAVGTITGTITNVAGGGALSGIQVQAFSTTGTGVGSVNTNGSGVYSISLAPGSYYLRTNTGGGFINEIYNDIPCQQCLVTGSGGALVPVNTGATTTNIDFALAAGGRISGTVTNASGGAAIQNIQAQVFSSTGVNMGSFNSNASGVFTTPGLPSGTYYVRTQNTLGFINKLWDSLACAFQSCAPTSGTPITVTVPDTTGNINFVLSAGGRISGTVTNAGGSPLGGVPIQTYNTLNRLMGTVLTNSAGSYTTQALPDDSYFVRTSNTVGYVDEVWDDVPCSLSCSPAGATPIAIASGANQTGKNFALAQGGSLGGTIRDANTLSPLQGVAVGVYATNGLLVRAGVTIVNGAYLVNGLPAGHYVLRTVNRIGYKDKIYDNLSLCEPSCLVTDGTQVAVTVGDVTSGVDFNLVASAEMVQNPDFNNGTTNWSLFATPDISYLVWQMVNGAFQYYRAAPPPNTSNSAVILQNTGASVPAGGRVLAQFDLANTSDARKRISILVHEGDFSDLSVCTFWVPANSGSRRYGMLTHTTKAWANATVSLYAASQDSNGGFYQIDNVTMQALPGTGDRTECVDPHKPPIVSDPDGPELLTNGDFSSGTSGWSLFGQITSQVSAGVFEFFRPQPPNQDPAGVILQPTGIGGAAGQIYTARFDFGNSSNVRKRVTVLLHDGDFSDLSACTYWIEPNTPLASYAMQSYATKAWTNATLSVYAASTDGEQWTRLDNVSFKKTTGAVINGTECFEPTSVPLGADPSGTAMAVASGPPAAGATSGRRMETVLLEIIGQAAVALPAIDLTQSGTASLGFASRVTAEWASARIEVSLDGRSWHTLVVMPSYDDWLDLDLDLSEFAGHIVYLRLVLDDPKATWEISWIKRAP